MNLPKDIHHAKRPSKPVVACLQSNRVVISMQGLPTCLKRSLQKLGARTAGWSSWNCYCRDIQYSFYSVTRQKMHAEPKSFQVFLGIFCCHVGLTKGTGVDFVGFSDRWCFTKDLRRRQLSQVGWERGSWREVLDLGHWHLRLQCSCKKDSIHVDICLHMHVEVCALLDLWL